ncbi:MAG: crotonase/enoyl-CoA hydratase family protein [Pseudomonadales bacterium]
MSETDENNSQLVTIDMVDGVADVRLNRPEKYNALSPAMFQAIIAAGEELSANKSLRAVVLSGNGPGFCAGLDMATMGGLGDGGGGSDGSDESGSSEESLLARDERPENFAQRPAMVWKRMPVPVIAALHGVAYGGGAQIALGADIRLAAPDTKLSIMEIKWGLIPDMSISQTLRDIVPLDVAKELTFTGRILSGEEAQVLGLVTRVVDDPRSEALALAREIAGKSPDAVRASKQLLETVWHADERTGLELESSLQIALIGSDNQVEAVKANFEKRPPNFNDPV